MRYRIIAPPADLSPYVRYFWTLEAELAPGETYVHRTMPDGCAELFFHCRGPFAELPESGGHRPCDLSGLSGPSLRYRRYEVRESFGMLGVYLYPFALPKLLRIPASSLVDQSPDLSSLLGAEGRYLEDRIFNAADDAARIAILTRFFRDRLHHASTPDAVDRLIERLIHTGGDLRVEAMAGQSFLSQRQLERRFQVACGMSPKRLARVLRFQKALSRFGSHDSLTDIAHACGYYDQAHFIHDFTAFSGHRPSDYFSGRTESTRWKQ